MVGEVYCFWFVVSGCFLGSRSLSIVLADLVVCVIEQFALVRQSGVAEDAAEFETDGSVAGWDELY